MNSLAETGPLLQYFLIRAPFSTVGWHSWGAGGIFPPWIQWQAAWGISQRSLWYWIIWVGVCVLFLFHCSTSDYKPLNVLHSIKSIKHYRKDLGILSTWQQKHSSESIASAVAKICEMFPSHGRETIRKELAMRYGIHTSWWVWLTTFLYNSTHKCLKCCGFGTSSWDGARCCEGTPCMSFPSMTVPCCWSQWCLGSRPVQQVGSSVWPLAPQ